MTWSAWSILEITFSPPTDRILLSAAGLYTLRNSADRWNELPSANSISTWDELELSSIQNRYKAHTPNDQANQCQSKFHSKLVTVSNRKSGLVIWRQICIWIRAVFKGYHVQKMTHSRDIAAIRIHMPIDTLVHHRTMQCYSVDDMPCCWLRGTCTCPFLRDKMHMALKYGSDKVIFGDSKTTE